MANIYLYLEKFNDMDIIENKGVKGVFLPINSNNIKLFKSHTMIKLTTFQIKNTRFCKTDCIFLAPAKDGVKLNQNSIGNMKIYPPQKAKFDKSIYIKKDLSSFDNALNEE